MGYDWIKSAGEGYLVSDVEKADVVLAVDMHNLAWRVYHAPMPKRLVDGYPTYHTLSALSRLGQCLDLVHGLYPSAKVCIAVSADEYYPRKKALFPEYKSGRQDREMETYEKDGVPVQINPVGDVVEAFAHIPHCLLGIPTKDEETDDIIASFIRRHRDKKFFVMSTDKDLWQLRRKDVSIIKKDSPVVLVTVSDVVEKFSVNDSRLIPFVKTLTGDSSDSLKGVPFFPRKLFRDMVYEDYGGDIEKGLDYMLSKASDKVAGKIKDDRQRLVSLHSIIKLRRDAEISEDEVPGNLSRFMKYLEDRKMKPAQVLKAWVGVENFEKLWDDGSDEGDDDDEY